MALSHYEDCAIVTCALSRKGSRLKICAGGRVGFQQGIIAGVCMEE